MKPLYFDNTHPSPIMEPENQFNNNLFLKELKSKSDIDTPERAPALKRKPEQEPGVPSYKKLKEDSEEPSPSSKPHQSPKKRINIIPASESKNKFIYGNYTRYYGYRNQNDVSDVRLDVFQAHKELFAGKEVLDIGCNCGLVTMQVAKTLGVAHITGIDIDKGLINKVTKLICKTKKASTSENREGFPFNVSFVHGNYVLRDDVLLEIESPQFDLILCLSVTKWIHLNFGDSALKQTFRRMYAQLREGGRLILEPQPWDGYKRRKKLTPEIFKNYQAIQFKPKDFTDYLMSPEVGFKTVSLLAVPDHCAAGFRRPIQVFCK